MAEVTEIRSIDDLDSYQLVWQSLLLKTRDATFFQSLDWLKVYWRHFGEDKQLRVLIISSAGETIGIVPLVVVTEPTRVGPVRFLTYPLHDWGSFYGPIGPNPTASLMAAMRHLRETPETGMFWICAGSTWTELTTVGRNVRWLKSVSARRNNRGCVDPW